MYQLFSNKFKPFTDFHSNLNYPLPLEVSTISGLAIDID